MKKTTKKTTTPIFFYTVAVAQNVLTANLKKKAQHQNADICLVLNIHDQLAALKVSLKDSFLLAQPTTQIYAHTWVLTIFSLYFYPLFNNQRQSGRLISISP